MASVRDQIIGAMVAALNTGAPVGFPTAERSRTADVAPTDLPSILVYPVRDSPDPVASATRPARRANLTVTVELRAAGTALLRPDQVVDQYYVWALQTLDGKRFAAGAGGFLNHDCVEGETTFTYEQGDAPYCLAAVEFVATYHHLRSNPELRT